MANRRLRAIQKAKPLMNQSSVSATETPSTSTITPSYRKIINLKVAADGAIIVNEGTFPIDFGALGDVGVTEMVFDTSALLWYNSARSDYQAILTFYNPSAPVAAQNNPLIYEFNGMDFVLPAEITNVDSVWQIIFTLKEITDDTVVGNIENPPEQEIFVSQQFEGKVSIINTQYRDFRDDVWFRNATAEDEGEPLVALAKNTNSILIDGENSWMATGVDQFWGYKFDRYVKRVKLTIPSGLTFFNEWYLGVVDNTNPTRKWLLKLNKDYICWIYPSITEVATTYSVSLIGRYLIDDVIDKVLYTNVLTRIVENNFLVSADWLIPNQESTMSQGSFLSSDDYYFVDVNNVEIITEDL